MKWYFNFIGFNNYRIVKLHFIGLSIVGVFGTINYHLSGGNDYIYTLIFLGGEIIFITITCLIIRLIMWVWNGFD